MASYNVLQSGMPTLPSTVSNYNGSSGRSITPNNGRNNIVRVTSVNIDDGSITYETLQNNTGRSFLGNPLPLTAKIANNTISSIPVIGELVEIFNAPSVDLANNKSQPVFDTYYRPVSINVWENQNNNVILDSTVPGQDSEDLLNILDTQNYERALGGFVPNDGLRAYGLNYIPSSYPSYIEFNLTLTDAQKQKAWLLSYIQSPIYKERLKKEFPGKDEVFIQAELNKRITNLKTSNISIIPQVGSQPGLAAGVSVAKTPSGLFWNGKAWETPSNKPDPKFKTGTVYVEKKQYGGFEGIPVHELSHVTDDAGSLIPMSTIQKIYKYTGGGDQTNPRKKYGTMVFDYYTTPTEFIARMNVLRYLMKQKGIYDAGTRAFTAQDLEKMLKDSTITDNTAFQEIFNLYSSGLKGDEATKKKAFIDLMNTVAYNEATNDIISRTA